MIPEVVVTSGLETLPPRPPTPPREKSSEADKQQQLLDRPSLDPRRSLQTPPDYSPYSSDLSDPTSKRTRKRVGFSRQTSFCEAPNYTKSGRKQPTPASVSSTASLSGPLKSILKPSLPVVQNPLDPSAGHDATARHASVATMLESTTKQLAGADRTSKLDAYSVLVRALKTSNNLPDRIALRDKMGLFTQFIQRDVTMSYEDSGELDSSLSNHASKLLITFLNFPAIASSISNEFGVFMMDHCIRSFENNTVPKEVVRHLMQIVASQDFSTKVMTADRVGRLVNSLHHIQDHLKGKSIIMSRIIIYRRLIKQSKSHMVTHSDWLLDLFADMLSSMKEIRETAIALGLEASFTIGKEKQLSKRVMEILELTVDESKYIQYYIGRLKTMTKSKDKNDSSAVPQIWSVVLLLLRCPVTKWEFFNPLLEVIQLCFNNADLQTKFEANYAWNRLVYCMQLNDTSFLKTMSTIRQPFESQLKRKKLSDETKRVVVGSLRNLYYYAFKPNTHPEQISKFWDACIPQLISTMVSPELLSKTPVQTPSVWQGQIPQATSILTALFNSSTPRIWKEDHIADSPLVKTDELPALDPKWLRRNAARVFAVIEPILEKTYLDLADTTSATTKLWTTLVGAVALAASKEIKVSADTAVFMAHTLTALLRIWSRGVASFSGGAENSRRFYEATATLISTLISSLGLLPFTEKQLSMGKQNTFLPIATPSHRPSKGQGVTRSPIHHLFAILSSLPAGAQDDDGFADLLRSTLLPFLGSKSHKAKVDLAHELMQSLPMDTLAPYGPWLVVSEILGDSLENSQTSVSSSPSTSQPPIGHEYREVVRHLERGLRSTPGLPWLHWQSLFQSLVARANEETGEAGCAIAVVEPVAKSILDVLANDYSSKDTVSLFRSAIDVISVAKQPRDRHAVESARRRLWGTSVPGSRTASFDVYDGLYKVINHVLTTTYLRYDEFETGSIVVPALNEVAGFLARCNQLLVFKTLVNLQDSIGMWIHDNEERYNSRHSASVSEAVKLLWNRICNIFIEADNLEQVQLDAIELLLCSAFESKHRHIVNTVSVMWNRAFEQADKVQYPDRLKTVLLSLCHYVDLVLPGLNVPDMDGIGQQHLFINSQEDIDSSPAAKPSPRTTPLADRRTPSRRSRSNTPGSIKLSVLSQRRIEATPDGKRLRSARRSATPKLRHNDSQIQFAAIASSSPGHDIMESQILTERQKEVRDRQQGSDALFPELRSSVEEDKPELRSFEQRCIPSVSSPEKVTTPKSHRSFEDYVSSTPTPRRGQAHLMDVNDHEMTDDIPSSPPDPRRYPLVPEINKPLSSSSSVLDDWQFMSSPVLGSPRHMRFAISDEQGIREPSRIQIPDRVEPGGKEPENPGTGSSEDEAESADVEDQGTDAPMGGIEDKLPPASQRPATPPNTRARKEHATPKSDNEVFVDALTSPTCTPRSQRALARAAQSVPIQAPKASQSKDRSFDASDVDERSLLRLVVEIDSRKCEDASEDPHEGDERRVSSQEPRGSPHLGCITVVTRSDKPTRRSKRSKVAKSSSPVIPVTPSEIVVSSQESNNKSKNKRKRVSEQSQESDSKKRRHSQDLRSGTEAVPYSQLPHVHDSTSSLHSETSGGERLTNSSPKSFSQVQDAERPIPTTEEPASADSSMDESEAVNLQIVQEASQNTEEPFSVLDPSATTLDEMALTESVSPPAEDANMAQQPNPEETELPVQVEAPLPHAADEEAESADIPEKSALEKIMDALKNSVNELSTAALARDEVHQLETMVMDIKRELYGAEFRGRN